MERVAVYIDNSNVFGNIQRARRKSRDLVWATFYDPLKLSQILAGTRSLTGVHFYCVMPPEWLVGEGGKSKERYLITAKYYAAVEKLPHVEVKYGYLQGKKGATIEKNVDTQLGVDMVAAAALNEYDTAMLISNDGDYTSAVKNVKRFGKKVELLFFEGSLSWSLKLECDLIRRARRSYFQPIKFDF